MEHALSVCHQKTRKCKNLSNFRTETDNLAQFSPETDKLNIFFHESKRATFFSFQIEGIVPKVIFHDFVACYTGGAPSAAPLFEKIVILRKYAS